jgi:hypothetical protein
MNTFKFNVRPPHVTTFTVTEFETAEQPKEFTTVALNAYVLPLICKLKSLLYTAYVCPVAEKISFQFINPPEPAPVVSAVSVTGELDPLSHRLIGPTGVTVGAGGTGLTVTETLFDDEHPFASVTVTV